MKVRGCIQRCLGLAVAVLAAGPGQAPAQGGEWKLDVLRLRNGRQLTGLLVEETASGVRFQCIRQKPGQRTFVFSPAVFHAGEIDGIDRLPAAEREQLVSRIKSLDTNGDGERQRMNDLDLRACRWPGGGNGLEYRSEQFVLVAKANEDIIRRAAVRLEDIFAAYTSHLPPRRQNSQPTCILLADSVLDYRKLVQAGGANILNPAFFDRSKNQVVCASDLRKMGEDLALMRQAFGEIRQDLDRQDAELDMLYGKNNGPPSFRQPIRDCRARLGLLARKNEQIFDQATQRLFQVLYHEAFHAYLDNFVYAPDQAELPRWLNEGLAQIFETAIVEAGELRVGHADEGRLLRAKAFVRNGSLVPLADLLRAGPGAFLVQHGSDRQAADRHYLTAWALAFYLTFDRQLLGTRQLDQYALDTKRGTDALDAFQQLSDAALADLEKAFHQYLLALRPDGTPGTLPVK